MKYLVAALLGALLCTALWGRYEANRAEGWRDYAKRLEIAAQAATAAQKALREQERQEYADKASDADARYLAALDRVRAATVRPVRADRVLSSGGGSALAVGSPSSAGVSAPLPADPAASERDAALLGWAECSAYAVGAMEWVRSVGD